jgi:flagellar protein FlaF
MGFSVSGSAALIFAAMFVSFGTLYPAVANGYERVADAQADASDRLLDQKNTEIEVVSAAYDDANETISVSVVNAGTSSLTVSGTDIIVDNVYLPPSAIVSRTVDGRSTTDLWLPGETLNVTVDWSQNADRPNRVAVATDHGVMDAEGI